jgi:hypothetical protein
MPSWKAGPTHCLLSHVAYGMVGDFLEVKFRTLT